MALMNPPSIQSVAEKQQQAHDAGFDAYMTGNVFIKLAYHYHLGKQGVIWVEHLIRTLRSDGFLHEASPANRVK